jgi:hypothetical protein
MDHQAIYAMTATINEITNISKFHTLLKYSLWNFLAHFFDFSLGGGFLGMRNRARIG